MEDWKRTFRSSYFKFENIEDFIKEDNLNDIKNHIERYPFCITRYYFDLINWNDENDPIRKMSIPNLFELSMDGQIDTSGESSNTKSKGIQHKYNPTVLVLTTNKCFMYCRHCFRKRLVGMSQEEILDRINEVSKYVKNHKEVNNVLLSGGDSFMLDTRNIKKYLDTLLKIEHLDFIRFGTRAPVVFPDRILQDENLVNVLIEANKKKNIIVVTQMNHEREITSKSTEAIRRLVDNGISVNNQTVLLKGVNDSVDQIERLFSNLLKVNVYPYYLFQCRPVKHVKKGFQLPLYKGVEIVKGARSKLNGLSKRFRYVMSHPRGKIEIIGIKDNKFIFKFHEAKNHIDDDYIFERKVIKEATWLDEDLNLI